MKVKSESEVAQCVRPFMTPWTAAYQAPLSMGFSKQEYWSGEPLPSPQVWVIVNNIAIAIHVQVFVWIRFQPFWIDIKEHNN